MSKFLRKSLILSLFAFAVICFFSAKNITGFAAENLDNLYVHLEIDGSAHHFTYPQITYKSGFEDILIKQGRYDKKGRLISIDGPFAAEYEIAGLKGYLEEIAKISDKEPVCAKVSFNPDNTKFDITPDIPGQRLNVDKIVDDVHKSLKQAKSYSAIIKSEVIYASVTESSLKRSFNLRSTFSTNISQSTKERKNNISLSLGEFNGLIVAPDEEISFNEIVGERTEKRGYKTAKIIMDGEFIDGIGGGVCQTSTTLYNALLLSDIEITRYKKHSLKVNYILPSFDAMVSKYSDLRFKNTSGNFIYFKTECTPDAAVVKIYGEKLKCTIIRKSEIVFTGNTPNEKKIIDTAGKYSNKVKYEDEYFILQSSKPKITSIGKLEYVKNGKVVKTKLIRKDTYNELCGTIVYGSLKRPDNPRLKPPEEEFEEKNPVGFLG